MGTKRGADGGGLPIREPDTHCNARNKRHDRYCQHLAGWGTAHPGTGRCKLHGGASLVGPAASNYKHGKLSKYLPSRLLERYDELRSDTTILELEDKIRLLDVVIADVLPRLENPTDAEARKEVAELLDQSRKLIESERRRCVEMQQMLTTEQAMTLLAVVVDTIRRYVTDRATLAAISADIARLVVTTPRG
jgi:hypothetical protein